MSKEDIKRFIVLVGDDEELAEKVKVAGTDVGEVIRLGKENGLEFTAGDMKALHDETAKSGVELSDEDLEKVAGGFVTSTAVVAVASVVGAAAAAVGAAAAVVRAAVGR